MSRYRHQYKNFGDAVLRSEWMVAEMRRRAEAVKAAAEALAPVGDPATDSHAGRYKASFRAEAGIRKASQGSRRAVGRVINDSPEALAVEYGTRNNEARHVMTSALDAAG
jgi:hypothetical protein